jgi:hypothetical protein
VAYKKKYEAKVSKALNVVEEVSPGKFQVFQLYAYMKIPLLGTRVRGKFEETFADSIDEAFNRLYSNYYE